ncbi:MAG TPA: hypothetical protein VFI06_03300, partial [Chitinophagaceae bacterium]|nr:hypothetical protein [Chitinophagaceae bacterium]
MKILFVSGNAPAKFNFGEPNSYPYYLIKELARRHELYVLYFTANKRLTPEIINQDLLEAGVSQHQELRSTARGGLLRYGIYLAATFLMKLLLMLRIKPPYSLIPIPFSAYKKRPPATLLEVVKTYKPDLAIFFPQLLQFAVKEVTAAGVPVSLLFTDSGALHFTRLMEVRGPGAPDRKMNYQQLIRFQKLEKNYSQVDARYFFVGHKDKEVFDSNSGQENHSFFIPHHLYSYSSQLKNWGQVDQPLNIVFTGGGHTIYTGEEADHIAGQIAASKKLQTSAARFYFLG